MTVQLSPPVLYEAGLAAALEWLGRHMQETLGLAVEVEAAADAEPESEDLRILLFEATRELLFNVVKHAGTGRARVTIADAVRRRSSSWSSPTTAPASTRPSRRPETAAGGGFGLFSIRERLELLGGRMEVDAAPGRGTRVTIVAPRRRSQPILDETRQAVPRHAGG